MTMTPCKDCHLANGCDIKAEKLRAVRGLKLTAIKFKCSVLTESLKPGMKVMASLDYVAVGNDPEGIGGILQEAKTVPAIIMGWSFNNRIRIYVQYGKDDGWWLQSIKEQDRQIHVIRVRPNQLSLTGETVEVCGKCGLPEIEEYLTEWNCEACL